MSAFDRLEMGGGIFEIIEFTLMRTDNNGQKVEGNGSAAVGPVETMVPGLPGQKVNGNSSAAVGPIETMGRRSTVIVVRLWAL